MKAKTKLTKLWTILLSLVMLLSLLPTTALAATYPGSVRVYNASGAITSLDDGECLVTNNGSATSYAGGTSYVARYDSGTLYLKDYHGVAADGQIYADGDLNIVVENDSSFTTSVSTTNNLYGIQAGGKLNISGSGKLTVTANGDGNVYGICANEGVTISAPLDVQVGKVDSSKNGPVYGIYTRSGAISLSGADKTITATGGAEFACGVYNEAKTSSTAADNGNINISGKLTVNLSNGFYNRGISSQGGDITLNGATVKILGSYYYGIFNKSGNVVIKRCPDVELTSTTSGGDGICTYDGGDLNIEDSTVKVSANGLAAELKGNVSIKDSMVDLTRTSSYYEVIKTDNSSATITIDLSTEGSVTLTASGEQTNNAMITGKVTLVGSTKCEKGRRNGSSYDGVYDGSSKTVLQFVHEGPAPATYTVSFDANGGTGTMADVTGISGEYTLPENGFTTPDGKQFKGWATSAYGSVISGTTYEVSSDTTFYAIWESKEYSIIVTDGKATIGAGSEISKAAQGTTITLTANAAPDGKVFDKWVVESGNTTLEDANSETTTFIMPDSEVSVKATYTIPHTHTYDQEIQKPETLKSAADCTNDAVYFKSCSCGEISTTETFTAAGTQLGHAWASDWSKDTDNHWKECSRCHEKKDEAAHDFKWVVDREATATKKGSKHEECKVCGYKKAAVEIPATGSTTKPTDPTQTNPQIGTIIKDAAGIFNYRITGTDTVEVKNMTAKGKRKKAVKISKTIKVNGRTLKVTGIAANAFKGNKKMTSVTIGSNVKKIGSGAFMNCRNLTRVTVTAKGLTSIGKNAFKGDRKLKTVNLRKVKALKKVGKGAFKGISKKVTVKVPKQKKKAYSKLLKKAGIAAGRIK